MILEQYEEALSINEQALALHRRIGDWHEEALTLNNLGITFGCLGRWEESEAAYLEALRIFKDFGGNPTIRVTTWNLATNCYWRQGQYQKAVEFVNDQIEWAMNAEDEWLVGVLNMMQGEFLYLFGQPEASLAALEVAHSIMEHLAHGGVDHAVIISDMALSKAQMGDLSSGKELMGRAMKMAEGATKPSHWAAPASNNAYLVLALGEPDRIQQACTRIEENLGPLLYSSYEVEIEEALHALVRLRLAMADPEGANEHAQALARMLDHRPEHWTTQEYAYSIAQAHWALGDAPAGNEYLKRAYDWISLVADQTENEAWRRSWLEDAGRNAEILQVAAERGIC
jgi:tetratricopeptide (TPR) repeat protein